MPPSPRQPGRPLLKVATPSPVAGTGPDPPAIAPPRASHGPGAVSPAALEGLRPPGPLGQAARNLEVGPPGRRKVCPHRRVCRSRHSRTGTFPPARTGSRTSGGRALAAEIKPLARIGARDEADVAARGGLSERPSGAAFRGGLLGPRRTTALRSMASPGLMAPLGPLGPANPGAIAPKYLDCRLAESLAGCRVWTAAPAGALFGRPGDRPGPAGPNGTGGRQRRRLWRPPECQRRAKKWQSLEVCF
jgi:hypothetical protein